MRIPLCVASEDGKEWILIELQGALERNQAVSDALYVGQFSFQQGRGTAELVIGDHILDGTEVILKKPFGIFRKVKNSDTTTLQLVSSVERKFLFNQRPRSASIS